MSLQSLFRTKSLDGILADAERPEFKLRRVLGPIQLTLLGIGAIVGAGIFATVGTAAAGDAHRPGAGPALIVSFLVTAVVCAFTALCYAELASMVPISGSAYTYSYATLGELVAWMIGWDLIIEYAVGNIAVAISWANYFKTFVAESFGVVIPDWASMDYRTAARIVDAEGVQTVFRDAPHVFGVPLVFNFLAVAIVAALTAILVRGIRESARFNAVMVGIKILVLGLFIVVGFSGVHRANWTPFAPNGWAGIGAGAAIVFFAYIGFDAVSTVAEETRNPQRDLPAGILASLVICTFLYVVVAVVFTGLVSYPALKAALSTEQAEPLILALRHAVPAGHWSLKFVALGSVIAHTAVLLVFQLGQPRIFFSMARDGLLPPFIARIHPRFRTPHVATILTGVFVAFFAGLASLDEMVDLTNIGTLFAFMLVCVGVIVLRVKEPARPRPFRVPAGTLVSVLVYLGFAAGIYFLPLSSGSAWTLIALGAVVFALARNHILPLLGVVSCLYLVYYLPPTSWLRFAAWLNFGFLIYVAYGSIRSSLTGRETSGDRLRHDAETAWQGACLAWIGTALLVATRALDLGGEASRSSWLAPSGFLLVPLGLNAFVLCPIVMARALSARRSSATGRMSARTLGTLALTALLVLGSSAYFIAVAAH